MQRKLHPLEGIVALGALILVLFLSVGFAQADEVRKIALRSSSNGLRLESTPVL